MFQNPEIPLEELPTAVDLNWHALDPTYIKLLRLQLGLFIIIPLVVITFVTREAGAEMPYLLIPYGILAAIAIWLYVFAAISVRHCGYVLRDKDMLFKKGVIWQSVVAVPFNRIQHVETSNTPFDRRFGLASLKLFTAGGSGGDLKIDGLPANTAEQLRLHILEKTGADIEDA